MKTLDHVMPALGLIKSGLEADNARRSLLGYVRATFPGYVVADHHRLIAEKLEAVERGEIKRIIIETPPRHGKSQLASIHFPAWYIGRNPEKQIITASYSGRLAEDFGRKVRNLIADPDTQNIFESVELAADSKAANRWHTNKGGVYMAVGVAGATTGRGADLFLIDDPIRDAEEADSELMRDKVWDWYTTVAYTRLMPDAAIVIILTRWHEDDLAGRIIEDMKAGGEKWEIVRLPALAEVDDPLGREEGAALWPDRYPIDALHNVRNVLTSRGSARWWHSLYQQNPTPDEGTFFKAEWFKRYKTRPDTSELTIYATSDYAVTDKGGDYTVHMIFGVDGDGNIYVLDQYRSQASTDEWVDVQIAMMKEWRPIEWVGEKGQIEKSVGPFLRKAMDERNVYCNLNPMSSMASKAQRAQAIRGRMAMGKVYWPTHTEWVADSIAECCRFPNGTHDDVVDALALMGRILDTSYGPSLKVVRKRKMQYNTGQSIIDNAIESNQRASLSTG